MDNKTDMPKNRSYKKNTKALMKAVLEFYGKVEELIDNQDVGNVEDKWELEDLSDAALRLGDALGKNIFRKNDYQKSKYWINKNGPYTVWRGFLEVLSKKYVFNRQSIHELYEVLFEFKENLYVEVNGEFLTPHFEFLGEKREVVSYFKDEKYNSTDSGYMDLSRTSLTPSVWFRKSALKAIKGSDGEVDARKGLKVCSDVKSFYIIRPSSIVAYRMWKVVGSGSSLEMNISELYGRSNWPISVIPSIYSKIPTAFVGLIYTIIIEYFVTFSNFNDLVICRVCNRLAFRNKNDDDVCGCNTCRWKVWAEKNPRDYAKHKCRNKQNTWVKRNTGQTHHSKSPDFCVDCDLENFPKGGKCQKITQSIENIDRIIAANKKEKMKQKEVMKQKV